MHETREREKASNMQEKQMLARENTLRKEMQRWKRELAQVPSHSNIIVMHLDHPLSCLLCLRFFRLPIGSHGAAQPRSELLPPWFPRMEGHQKIHTLRESAVESLDAVVPD